MRIDADLAKKHIEAGAEVLYMLPVYEEKIKDGKVVHKVRLVVNGKHHNQHGPTYSPTPSRDELLVLLHICVTLDCEMKLCHRTIYMSKDLMTQPVKLP